MKNTQHSILFFIIALAVIIGIVFWGSEKQEPVEQPTIVPQPEVVTYTCPVNEKCA